MTTTKKDPQIGCCYNQKAIDKIITVLDGNGRPSLQTSLFEINMKISALKEDVCVLKCLPSDIGNLKNEFIRDKVLREQREIIAEESAFKKEDRLRWIVPLVVSNLVIIITLIIKIILGGGL